MKMNMEMKIYEFLGIKFFKKMVIFLIPNTLWKLFTLGMSKEERKDCYNNSNYFIGKVKSLDDVKRFKKMLYLNAGIHIYYGIIVFLSLSFFHHYSYTISGAAYIGINIFILVLTVLNLYCIMLQRYNCIRINHLIKKMKPHYERQIDSLKHEIIKSDSLISEHTYEIVNKKGKVINKTFKELIANANYDELLKYHDYLMYLKSIQSSQQNVEDLPIKKQQTLKLELKK